MSINHKNAVIQIVHGQYNYWEERLNYSSSIELSSHGNQGVKCAATINSVTQYSNYCARFKPAAMHYGSKHILHVSPIALWRNHFIAILKSGAPNSGPLVKSANYLTISYVLMIQFAYCWDLVYQNCYICPIFYYSRIL